MARQDDAPGLFIAPFPDVPLGLYVHHSGSRHYVVGGGVLITGEDEAQVTIISVPADLGKKPRRAVHRTYKDWTSLVPGNGCHVPRFHLLKRRRVADIQEYLYPITDRIVMNWDPRQAAADAEEYGPDFAAI